MTEVLLVELSSEIAAMGILAVIGLTTFATLIVCRRPRTCPKCGRTQR